MKVLFNSGVLILGLLAVVVKSDNRVFTKEELAKYNGEDPNLPIYLAIRGLVFDVSSKRDFYGKDGAYGIFAGKDCTKAIAKWTKNEEDMTSDISDLNEEELEGLENALNNIYKKKYKVVGVMDYSDMAKREKDDL